MQTAALVSRTGSVDWLCLPRFDSDACFAALLGTPDNGCWQLAPEGATHCNRRRYREDTLILETEWETTAGAVRVIDFMPPRGEAPDIVRIVEGISGRVDMRSEVRLRFDYGSVRPWVRKLHDGLAAVVGPDSVHLRASVPVEEDDGVYASRFAVSEGDRVSFVLTWQASFLDPPKPVRAERALKDTEKYWTKWLDQCSYDGDWREAVVRSLITLKALTYAPTGGVTAAATSSLPESLGAGRNWDYRYCWLRDASVTLESMLLAGYLDEARAWREWLLRAVGGDPAKLRIMYGLAGERRLPEAELEHLTGYDDSRPVRIGNLASEQFQLDVYGEVLDLLHLDRCSGLSPEDDAWKVQIGLLEVLESRWQEPDRGLWEMRGDPRQFVHSKVMAWVGFDRAVRAVEHFGLDGPVDRWRRLRDEVHAEICTKGFDADRNTFTQTYGSEALDSATLLIPQVGFLPGDDPRVVGTVEAVQRELSRDGFLLRYDEKAEDGFESEEGAFIACSIWLADDLDLIGRPDEAREIFERVLDIRNDVGLLSEEYDHRQHRQIGNVPQAYSHVALVNTAHNLSADGSRDHSKRRRRAKRNDDKRAG